MPEEDENFAFELKIKSKRGTGTRDQDTVQGTVRADDLETLRERKNQMLDEVEFTMETARGLQVDNGQEDIV